MNVKVVILSIIALGFIALTFLVDWLFIIGAVIITYINQKELLKKNKNNFSFYCLASFTVNALPSISFPFISFIAVFALDSSTKVTKPKPLDFFLFILSKMT